MVISISDGNEVKQFGPTLSHRDKASIRALLCPGRHIRGANIIWHAMDLVRILGTHYILDNLHNITGTWTGFDLWKYYGACSETLIADCRESRELAAAFATTSQAWAVTVIGSPELVTLYSTNLPLWRMKWLEIQDETKAMQGWTVSSLPITEKDVEDYG